MSTASRQNRLEHYCATQTMFALYECHQRSQSLLSAVRDHARAMAYCADRRLNECIVRVVRILLSLKSMYVIER